MKKQTNPENFDDGLTQVAPKGEFKLSDKRKKNQFKMGLYLEEDIKEFIQRIEMTMLVTPSPMEKGEFILWLKKEIDKLTGDLR